MKNIGYSTFNASVGTDYRLTGPTGPTGPTGSTGPVGPTGNTGATGNGVFYISKINFNGITVELVDGTRFTITGISGDAPTDFSTLVTATPYVITGVTNTASDAVFLSTGANGLTAYFKPFKGINGITIAYNGNNLIFTGITLTNYALGPTGSVLYALGNTASPLISQSLTPIFLYQTVTVGSTTQDLSSGIISSFLQAKTASGVTNINTINASSISTWISNIFESTTNSFYLSGNTWNSTQIYQTGLSKVNGSQYNTGVTYINSKIFDVSNTITFGRHEYGSCCYCNGDGNKTCLDYVRKSYCEDTLDGAFSKNSCKNRMGADCSTIGACCINGHCVDTTRSICEGLGGSFNYQHSCSAGNQQC